ncbi:MAG: hypothetical protein U1F83_01270 [Verrucomicrobiota bacterium]
MRLFKRAADDLVEVVLTPDAKTQISLRLQWREGQVEAQARCDLGDFRALNSQWPQLQAALAAQGVRLSHLSERVQSGFTDFFNSPSFAQSHGGQRQPTPPPVPQDELAPGGGRSPRAPLASLAPAAGPGPVKKAGLARRLWESWA